MKFFLFCLSALSIGLVVVLILRASTGTAFNMMSEIECLTLLVLSAMFFCASAVVGALEKFHPQAAAEETPEEVHARQVREAAGRLIPSGP